MRHIDAANVTSVLRWAEVVGALRAALVAGLTPDADPERTSYRFPSGELLVMPSIAPSLSNGRALAGVKVATVAPNNPQVGLPRIHAAYTVFDAATLVPLATLDGTALTNLRTPAVSALGVDAMATADAHRLLVFGTGPQAYGHIHAIRAVRDVKVAYVVGRDSRRTAAFVSLLKTQGIDAVPTTSDAVSAADVVACCTTAREPLFDGNLLSDRAVVTACGSHRPDEREVDTATVRRCGAVVESVGVACREAGDVILAISDGAITAEELVPLADLVVGRADGAPRFLKTVGMGWEDLVVAAAVIEAVDAEQKGKV